MANERRIVQEVSCNSARQCRTSVCRIRSQTRDPDAGRYAGVDDCSVSWYVVRMKVREAIKAIQADGWYLVATRGSHRQYKHPSRRGRVTIAGHTGDDLAAGTLNSILKQAGLK